MRGFRVPTNNDRALGAIAHGGTPEFQHDVRSYP